VTTPSTSTSLTGLNAIVTGAGGGLGRAEALALATGGAKVLINDVNPTAADAVVAEIKAAGGEAVALAGDIGDWNFASSLVDGAVEAFGTLDIVVNNAGITRDRMVFGLSEEEWDTVLRVHLKGHAALTRAATAYWRARSKEAGGPVYARIINTASEAFLFGAPGQPNYAAAKGGIAALTLSTVNGCSRYGVRANAIAPRARTAMTAGTFPEPEPGQPDPYSVDQIAPVVTWLASPAADHVTGQLFVTYGGKIAVIGAPTIEATYRSEGTWTAAELAESVGSAIGAGKHRGYAIGMDFRLE
jgi:3-oxoacyl-[acyl-carrier protein] reductase